MNALKPVAEYKAIYTEFKQSMHYKVGTYASYCYFKHGIAFESELMAKVLAVVYIGMRAGALSDRLTNIRKDFEQ